MLGLVLKNIQLMEFVVPDDRPTKDPFSPKVFKWLCVLPLKNKSHMSHLPPQSLCQPLSPLVSRFQEWTLFSRSSMCILVNVNIIYEDRQNNYFFNNVHPITVNSNVLTSWEQTSSPFFFDPFLLSPANYFLTNYIN